MTDTGEYFYASGVKEIETLMLGTGFPKSDSDGAVVGFSEYADMALRALGVEYLEKWASNGKALFCLEHYEVGEAFADLCRLSDYPTVGDSETCYVPVVHLISGMSQEAVDNASFVGATYLEYDADALKKISIGLTELANYLDAASKPEEG